MRYLRQKMCADERGSQTIEFLMLIPAIFLLALCLGEFGRAALCKISLLSAVSGGARLAALNAPDGEVESAVRRLAGTTPVHQVEIVRLPALVDSTFDSRWSGDVKVRAVSYLPLQVLARLGLPEHLRQLRIEAETQVPMVK